MFRFRGQSKSSQPESTLEKLRRELEDERAKLKQEQRKFQQLKKRTAGRKSRRTLKISEAREKLKKLRNTYEKEKALLDERKQQKLDDKRKHEDMLQKLRDQTDDLVKEYQDRKKKLEKLEKANITMKEELAKAKLKRDQDKENMENLTEELERVKIRDQRLFFSNFRHGTRRGPEDVLQEEVSEKCQKMRGYVLKRYDLRNEIRKKQKEIQEAKTKIQEQGKEIESIMDHENHVVNISNSILNGLETSSVENVLKGTSIRSDEFSQQELLEKLTTSTQHLEQVIRDIPEEFQSFENSHDGTSVNPKYRWLITSLLQKIGLLMIQFNHQQMGLNNMDMNYSKHLISLRSRNLQLRNELEVLKEHQAYDLTRMVEEIPDLIRNRDRLRKCRELITQKFEEYKQKRLDLDDTIHQQQKEIEKNFEVFEEHSALCLEREQLQKTLREGTEDMHVRGNAQSTAINDYVIEGLKQQGFIDNDGEEDDEPSESYSVGEYGPGSARSHAGEWEEEKDWSETPSARRRPASNRGADSRSRGRSPGSSRSREISPGRDDSPGAAGVSKDWEGPGMQTRR